MYVGSCNLWPEAISGNRELGMVTKDKLPIQSVYKTFQNDWETAVAYEEAKLKSITKN
jgi:phosphatidylserine/phosphatidylglycerophosphate/cardiolipin synthase-like enzyme